MIFLRTQLKITLETQGIPFLRKAREFAFHRISAVETDSSVGHVRSARRPREGNERTRNFNDHPSRLTANFSCVTNSSVPRVTPRYIASRAQRKIGEKFLEEIKSE